jgi:hypothetical protein
MYAMQAIAMPQRVVQFIAVPQLNDSVIIDESSSLVNNKNLNKLLDKIIVHL